MIALYLYVFGTLYSKRQRYTFMLIYFRQCIRELVVKEHLIQLTKKKAADHYVQVCLHHDKCRSTNESYEVGMGCYGYTR